MTEPQTAPINEATILAILAAAEEAEIGIAIRFLDATDLQAARAKIYECGGKDLAQSFQLSIMDNPKEIWIIKKTTDVELD